MTANAIIKARDGATAPLEHLGVTGIKPLSGTAEELIPRFEALLTLGMDGETTVCTAVSHRHADREDKSCCGKLFLADIGVECDLCDDLFCDAKHILKCGGTGCTLEVCAGCLPDAIRSEHEDETLQGFLCGCGKMRCGDCAASEVFASGQIASVTCGVCEKILCAECGIHGSHGQNSCGLTCGTTAYANMDKETCLRFVCDGCYWDRTSLLSLAVGPAPPTCYVHSLTHRRHIPQKATRT